MAAARHITGEEEADAQREQSSVPASSTAAEAMTAMQEPAGMHPADVLRLQRTVGNQAVSGMLARARHAVGPAAMSPTLQRNGTATTPAPAGPYTGYGPPPGQPSAPPSKSPAEVLKECAESLTEIGGTAATADKDVVVAEVIKIPIVALSALKKKGTKIVVCRNSVTEIMTELAGVQPRGWPPGKTWDSVPGLQDPAGKRVIIATRGGKVPPTGDGHGSANLVLHEVGHAIGGAVTVGGEGDAAFIAAREADKAKLDSYEGQAGQAGVEETYAESLARFYSGDPNDATTYPHLHAYWAGNPFVAKKAP